MRPRESLMLLNIWQDVRYALRGLARTPVFAGTAVLALALGIGVNTGLFSILNGVIFRDLPAPNAHELVSIHQRFEGARSRSVHGSRSMFSTREFETYRDRNQTLSGVMSYSVDLQATLGGASPRIIQGTFVSCNYFQVLELTPAMGPGFHEADCKNLESSRAVVLAS